MIRLGSLRGTTEGIAQSGVRYPADKQQLVAAWIAHDGGQWETIRVACAGYRIICDIYLFLASPTGQLLPAKTKLKVLSSLYSMVNDTISSAQPIFLILCDAGQIRCGFF